MIDPDSLKILSDANWQYENEKLIKTFEFENFVRAMVFVNRTINPVEELYHHPKITITYHKVTFELTTHDAGKVTDLDFKLALAIEELYSTKK